MKHLTTFTQANRILTGEEVNEVVIVPSGDQAFVFDSQFFG